MPLSSIEDELSSECQNARRAVEQLVEIAELAFARRQFQNSLDSSNQVLRKQRRQGTIIGGKKPETLLDMVESLSVPCLGWEKVMKPSPGRARAWRVDYGSEREITLEDRAAAVALQSIYELSKVDAQYKNDVCFLKELDPFVKYYFYDNDADEDEMGHYPSMPLQLLVVWVQFCIFLSSSSSNSGWPEAASIAFSTSLEVLSQLLPLLSDHQLLQPSSACTGVVIMDHCDDLMDALFLQLLVRLVDEHDNDSSSLQDDFIANVVNRLFLPSHQKEASIIYPKLVWRDENEYLKLLPQANPNKVALLLAEFERVAVQISPGVLSQRIEEVVYQLSLLADSQQQSHETACEQTRKPKESANNNIHNEDDNTTERRTTGSSHLEDENHHVVVSSSWPDFVQHQIVDPLWNSDDRWTNRAQVAAVGTLTYMTWKKRRRMGAMGHGLFVAPLREIMQAACIIASPTTTTS